MPLRPPTDDSAEWARGGCSFRACLKHRAVTGSVSPFSVLCTAPPAADTIEISSPHAQARSCPSRDSWAEPPVKKTFSWLPGLKDRRKRAGGMLPKQLTRCGCLRLFVEAGAPGRLKVGRSSCSGVKKWNSQRRPPGPPLAASPRRLALAPGPSPLRSHQWLPPGGRASRCWAGLPSLRLLAAGSCGRYLSLLLRGGRARPRGVYAARPVPRPALLPSLRRANASPPELEAAQAPLHTASAAISSSAERQRRGLRARARAHLQPAAGLQHVREVGPAGHLQAVPGGPHMEGFD